MEQCMFKIFFCNHLKTELTLLINIMHPWVIKVLISKKKNLTDPKLLKNSIYIS